MKASTERHLLECADVLRHLLEIDAGVDLPDVLDAGRLEIVRLRSEVERLVRERDEARALLLANAEALGQTTLERDEARRELADIQEQYVRVVADRCPSDERHCGCVGFLRHELAAIRSEATVDAVIDAVEACTSVPPQEHAYINRLHVRRRVRAVLGMTEVKL